MDSVRNEIHSDCLGRMKGEGVGKKEIHEECVASPTLAIKILCDSISYAMT